MNRATIRIRAMMGRRMARILSPAAPKVSRREKIGLAKPPVVVSDSPRKATVEAWTKPAAPPPAMMAKDQRKRGEKSPSRDAVARIPAKTAAGVAMESSRWSNQGIK